MIIRLKIAGQSEINVDLDQVAKRMVQEAFLSASAKYWDRRADTFEWVGPTCAAEAEACRNHAEAIRRGWIEVIEQ